MLAKVLTGAVVGLEGQLVQVEVDISPGLPAFNVVGLPDTAVQEARERVRAAVRNSGFEFKRRRVPARIRFWPMALCRSTSEGPFKSATRANPVPSTLCCADSEKKGTSPSSRQVEISSARTGFSYFKTSASLSK